MKKIFLAIAFLASFCLATELKIEEDPAKALEIGKQQNKKVIMFIHTKYCPWCSKMKKETLKDEKVINLINEKFIFSSVDQDKGLLPANLNPKFVPMTYVIDTKMNKVVGVLPGFMKADIFMEEISKY